MSAYNSGVRAYVDIYPFEGGQYTLTGNQSAILDLSVSKNIRSDAPGAFSIHIAPGGPNGVNSSPIWQDIITPMSLVVIGLQRYSHQQIVMVGVVNSVRESTVWQPGKGVRRSVEIVGEDFQNLFITHNFYLQLYLAFSTQQAIGSDGFLSTLGIGASAVPPEQMAALWFNNVMAGTNGVLADLSFAYQGTRLTFSDMMSTVFEPYGANIQIPMGDYFLSSEGTWLDKFKQIFPFPWYEMFVTTAPLGSFGGIIGQKIGYPITMQAMPGAEAVSPFLVGRANPLPYAPSSSLTTTSSIPTAMDLTAWDALPEYTLDNIGFVQSDIATTESEIRNFYVINPVAISNMQGVNNAQIVPFIYTHGAWLDTASVHRFGMRPQISEIYWLNDPTGANAQALASTGKGQQDMDALVSNLALRQTSYFEPTALMRRAQVTMELRPDILPGTKFTYAPYKDGLPWTFYIEGVNHHYGFGGTSSTTLSLSRGLPLSIYDNSDVLLAIHTGDAQLLNGQFVRGLPPGIGPNGTAGTGLQPINTKSILQGIMGQVAGIFSTPQPANT